MGEKVQVRCGNEVSVAILQSVGQLPQKGTEERIESDGKVVHSAGLVYSARSHLPSESEWKLGAISP